MTDDVSTRFRAQKQEATIRARKGASGWRRSLTEILGRSRLWRLSESDAHLMGPAVVGQRNLIDAAWDYGSVDLDRGNPAGGAAWIFHHNLVSGGVISEFDLEVS